MTAPLHRLYRTSLIFRIWVFWDVMQHHRVSVSQRFWINIVPTFSRDRRFIHGFFIQWCIITSQKMRVFNYTAVSASELACVSLYMIINNSHFSGDVLWRNSCLIFEYMHMWYNGILCHVHHLELELLQDCCACQLTMYLWYELSFQILKHVCTIIKENLALTTCTYVLSVLLPHLNVQLTTSFRPTLYT